MTGPDDLPGAAEAPGGGWDRIPFLIAHRGYSSVAPENTLAAFERALDCGADVIECDVQLTADSVAVVVHDPRVDRTTDGSGLVRDLTWRQVARLDAGYARRFGTAFAGERVPRLEQVLALARGRAHVFVEIKPESVTLGWGDQSVEACTLRAARRTGMLGATGVLSFSPHAVRAVRGRAPGVPVGLVFRWWRQRFLEETIATEADYLVAYAPRLIERPGLVGAAHARGLRVGAYVVDDEALLRQLLRLGVDGIASNRVGDLLPILSGGAEDRRAGEQRNRGPAASDGKTTCGC